ncbi:hypothetical protein ACWEK5_51110 [Rhodococcus koreensis]
MEPGALEIQERRALGIYLLLSTGNSGSNGSRMSVKFRRSAVGVPVVEKIGGRAIAPNQQLLVREARRRAFVELRDCDVLHELQRDAQQLIIHSQKCHRHAAQCCHDRGC